MKIALLCIAVLFSQEPTGTLQETLTWLSKYMISHGFLYEKNALVQVTRLRPVRVYTVELERKYPRTKTKASVKRQTTSFDLSDFDPTVHVQLTRTGDPSFMVTITRLDSREALKVSWK
jgi:hypothetical protein